jgi:transketolase
MRNALSNRLVEAARRDPKVVLLTGDHGYALFDDFRQKHPDQYFNAGIAEQNMIGMAAGLARAGFRPIVYGLSAFVPIRVLEQIKLDLAHDELPVLLLGDGAGFVYSQLGTSHQSTEDIACLRSVPNVTIFSPADAFELDLCFDQALQRGGTTYLRIGKADKGAVHAEAIGNYHLGDLLPVVRRPATDIALIATGSMVTAATRLAKKLRSAEVWSAPTIKPLNADQIVDIASNVRAFVTLEEHSVLGGLGGAVSEILSERAPTRVIRVGVNDRFSKLCGTYEYLLGEHRLDDAGIEARVLSALEPV